MSSEQEVEAEPVQAANPKICYWEKIPDEIREKIFKEVDSLGPDVTTDVGGPSSYFRRSHEMPALVIALRELLVSYGHVMGWFAKANSHMVIYFDPDDCDLNDMTWTELEVVESAELIFL